MKFSAITLILLLPINPIFSQDWTLLKNEDSIQIFSRNHSESDFNQFKVKAYVQHSPPQVYKVLEDLDNYKNWKDNLAEAKTISRNKDTAYFYYQFDLVWPFDNRDMIIRSESTLDKETNSYDIRFFSTNDIQYPKNEDVVRMQRVNGYWKLSPAKNGGTLIDHVMFADLGGKMPAWLLNSFSVTGTYNSMQGLRDECTKKFGPPVILVE